MQKGFKRTLASFIFGIFLGIGIIASAATVDFPQDVTASFTVGNCTIKAGSIANSVDIANNSLTIVQLAGQEFTIHCPISVQLTSTPNIGETCEGGLRVYRQTAGTTLTTSFTAAASTGTCGSTTGTGNVGGGGGAGGASSPSTPYTKPAEELPYYQLPEKNEKGTEVVNEKDVKFPSNGKVTKKTFMKNNQNQSSYLLQFGAKVRTIKKKPYTGLVKGPKSVATEKVPAIKLPKGQKVVAAVQVEFEEMVKITGRFQLKIQLPESVLNAKNFDPKNRKRFRIFTYDEGKKKWMSAGSTLLAKDGKSVYVKTAKYGYFVIVDTGK